MKLARLRVLALAGALGSAPAWAHGPQLQITADPSGKIVTRNLMLDEPYRLPLTDPVSVYVMPLGPTSVAGGTEYYVRPNLDTQVVAGQTVPKFNSGPGVAYGNGWTFNGPGDFTTTFPVGSFFTETLVGGLKRWDGSAFVDAGAAQIKAFRSTLTAVSADGGTASINFGAITAPTAPDPEPHGGMSFVMLGDGVSSTSALADGIYLATLRLSNSASAASASDDFYFVLPHNVGIDAARAAAAAAFPGAAIQAVPEPGVVGMLAVVGCVAAMRRNRRQSC